MKHIVFKKHRIKRLCLLLILLIAVSILSAPRLCGIFFDTDKNTLLSGAFNRELNFYDFSEKYQFHENVSLDVNFLNKDSVRSNIKIDELELCGLIISADVFLKGKFDYSNQESKRTFSGKLYAENITLNSNPFMRASMSFEIAGDKLNILEMRLGKSYKLSGYVGMAEPFETKLRLDIIRADIRDIVRVAKIKNPSVVLGIVNGFFNINGSLKNLLSNGMLESRNGKIGPIDYTFANVRLEGFGHIINIKDAALKYGSSTVTVDGVIDLRSLAKGDMFNGLTVRSDMKALVWKDWDINNDKANELSMSKEVNEKIKVGFKTVARDASTIFYKRENPEEMKLEYKLGEENLNLKLKENEGFFGIEHNVKF